jgi:hypothetical protein
MTDKLTYITTEFITTVKGSVLLYHCGLYYKHIESITSITIVSQLFSRSKIDNSRSIIDDFGA